VRFIQVGVGGFGGVWVKVLKENPAAQVVAMVDVSKEALAKACADGDYEPGICFSSLGRALKRVEADAIVSCTPPRFHKHDVVMALRAGLHAISEKPMADSLANCKAMLKTAIATGKTYTVSQNYRYGGPMWTMAKLVRSGRLGKVGQVKLDFFKGVDFGGGFRHDMEYPLVVDMSIHHFDLIRFITGLDMVSVQGTAWNPSWSNYKGDCSSALVFEAQTGARLLYSGSWCAKGDFCDWNGNWQIECERGTVTYQNGEIRVHEAPELYKVERTEVVPVENPPKTGQAYVLDEFIRAAESGQRPATDVYDNIRSVAMIFAAVKAMKTGRKVPVLDPEVEQLLAAR
jgi:predicted dehydrogenase